MTQSRIPVVLFAYARPEHLRRVLACLKTEGVPMIYAFSDGARAAKDESRVQEVRALLKAIDWAEMQITERSHNMGLGPSVLAGVTEVARVEDAWIVWEDDLICSNGAYRWLCEALCVYAGDDRVMSVTGWTHPSVRPRNVEGVPYFDRRAECWVWGAWRRSWHGMIEQTAMAKLEAAAALGVPPDVCGSDLISMARNENESRIWAVRWLYHHLQHNGLCVRPPWTMVEHIGSDALATNCDDPGWMRQAPLRDAAAAPLTWPEPAEHPDCATLWRAATAPSTILQRVLSGVRRRWLGGS